MPARNDLPISDHKRTPSWLLPLLDHCGFKILAFFHAPNDERDQLFLPALKTARAVPSILRLGIPLGCSPLITVQWVKRTEKGNVLISGKDMNTKKGLDEERVGTKSEANLVVKSANACRKRSTYQ